MRIRIVNRVPVNTPHVYQHQRFKNGFAQIEDESRKNVAKGEETFGTARFHFVGNHPVGSAITAWCLKVPISVNPPREEPHRYVFLSLRKF